MTFRWTDVGTLLTHLDAEANGESVDRDLAMEEARRLMALYPGMAAILAPIAERHSRQAA
ncbi:hypothetical protein H261_20679 [Paramagnetospirillum caucaseum]|uniref:Uncharacterized protein n=1 Tax=Paramagnetospirillum caucaseum TaxID=1244869 RepID=M3A6A3_9PROT|nr:hypothetical protein [Paramagnetospirillum caucaseum]EME67999.1 hypothetical protein H261_20679 [Paramagnetospirillum caucaseum]